MSKMRINHVEFSVSPGTLARDRDAMISFYGDVFDMGHVELEIDGLPYFILNTDEEGSQFIGLFESDDALRSQQLDHMGFYYEEPGEVDELLARCRDWQRRDPRMEIKEYPDLVLPATLTHSFYFKYLFPIWIHVASIVGNNGHAWHNHWQWTGPVAAKRK